MYELETVAIRNKHGRRAVITKSKFDPKTMRLWSTPAHSPDEDGKKPDGKKPDEDGKK